MVAKGLARKKIASGGARQPWWREVGLPFVEIGSGKILAFTLVRDAEPPPGFLQALSPWAISPVGRALLSNSKSLK